MLRSSFGSIDVPPFFPLVGLSAFKHHVPNERITSMVVPNSGKIESPLNVFQFSKEAATGDIEGAHR